MATTTAKTVFEPATSSSPTTIKVRDWKDSAWYIMNAWAAHYGHPHPSATQADPPPGSTRIGRGFRKAVRKRLSRMRQTWDSLTFRVLKFCACIPDDVIEDVEEDMEIMERVQEEMLTVHVSDRPPREVAEIELNDLHHDGVTPEHSRSAAVHTRFVVQVVVALRCKLGLGATDRSEPSNVALVRREAAKLMREWGVRDHDVSIHLAYVERVFFEDNSHEALPEWRARAALRGRLCKWLFERERPKYTY